MRIVLLSDRIPPEGMGGAENLAWGLAQGLHAAGQEAHVIATTPGSAFDEVRQGVPTHHLHAGYPERWRAWLSLWNPQTVYALKRLLQRLRPDIVNAHNIHFYLSYHSLKVARDLGMATVFCAYDCMPFAYGKLRHFVREDSAAINLPQDYRLPRGYNLCHNRFRYNPARNVVIRRCLRRYAQFRTVPSQALADAYAVNDLPTVEVAPNGVDPALWMRPPEPVITALRDRLDLRDKRVILFAGRLSRDKGTVQLLRAMDRVKDELPNMRLLALTARDIDGQIPADFRHLRPMIRSAGWLSGDELRAAFHLADVVTTPSIAFDTFPTVNLEAMACGKPVITTCFGGAPEQVVDGETGFVVNPLDCATFADRLRLLLGDAPLRESMGMRGRERLLRRFTLARHVNQMLDIYARASERTK